MMNMSPLEMASETLANRVWLLKTTARDYRAMRGTPMEAALNFDHAEKADKAARNLQAVMDLLSDKRVLEIFAELQARINEGTKA